MRVIDKRRWLLLLDATRPRPRRASHQLSVQMLELRQSRALPGGWCRRIGTTTGFDSAQDAIQARLRTNRTRIRRGQHRTPVPIVTTWLGKERPGAASAGCGTVRTPHLFPVCTYDDVAGQSVPVRHLEDFGAQLLQVLLKAPGSQ